MDINQAFISRVLADQGQQINDATVSAIRNHIRFKYGRTGRLENGQRKQVSGNRLEITHPIHKRFLDMRAKNRDGQFRKKKYPIHNRIIMGHYNEIARDLMYGLTQDVIRELKQELS